VYADATTGSAPARGRTPRKSAFATSGGGAQVCTARASGLTEWPIEQIAEAIGPNDEQRAALDRLQQAAAQAVALLQSACPDALPSTPTGRLAAMRERLQSMRKAVQIVRPALDRFYQSLSDEQKARFNALGPDRMAQNNGKNADLTQVCSGNAARVSNTPIDRVKAALKPNEEQRAALERLDEATHKAADLLAAHCSADEALTPPGRLAAMEKRLDAMLQALDLVQPALTAFYDSLSDEQKARFNRLGTQRQAGR
jgi:hypothetical protein